MNRLVSPVPDHAALFDPTFSGERCAGPLSDTAMVDVPQVGMIRYQRRGLPADVSLWFSSYFCGDFTARARSFAVQRINTGSTIIWFQGLDHDRTSRRGRVMVVGGWPQCPIVPITGIWHSEALWLRPGAFQALFGIPARDISQQRIDLDELLPGEGRALTARLLEQATGEDRYQVLIAWARARIARQARTRDLELINGLRDWIASSGPLRDITCHTGDSQRHLQRSFASGVGMTPGSLSRLWQVGRALRSALTCAAPDWSLVAHRHGFADQAHLTRRWKEVLGDSPARYHRRWRSGAVWLDGLVFLPTEGRSSAATVVRRG